MSGVTLSENSSPTLAGLEPQPTSVTPGSVPTGSVTPTPGVRPAALPVRLAYGLADQVLSVGGMFAVNIALARLRSKEEYGSFALSYSIFTLLSGLHNAAILEVYTIYGSGRYHHRFAGYGKLLWRTNAWVLAGITTLLLGTWRGLRWWHPAFAAPALLGVALSGGVLMTASFIRRTFYMRRRPDLAARFSGAFFVSCMILLALAIRRDWLNGLSAFLIVAAAWLIAVPFVRGEMFVRTEPGANGPNMIQRGAIGTATTVPDKTVPDDGMDFLLVEPDYWAEHWKYARWVLVTALVFQFTAQAYFWVVAGLLSVRDVAELRALYNLALPVDQIFAAVSVLVLPQMALLFATRELGKLRHLWWKFSLLFFGISAAFALLVSFESLPLLHFVYGGKFDNAAPLLRWYALLPVVMGIGNAANAALKAVEKPQAVFYAYLTSGAATFVFGIALVMHLGLRGAVYGMLLSGASYTAVLSSCFYRFNRASVRSRVTE